MKSAVKIRLYPTKRQKHEIFRQFEVHRNLYNYCLEERRDSYEKDKTTISCYDQIKRNVPKFGGSNCSSLQQTVRRLDKTFKSFFRRVKNGKTPGYPRFKGKFNSVDYCYSDGCKIRGDKVYFQHIGVIKAVIHRNVENPSRCVLNYQNGDFYAYFITDASLKTLDKTGQNVGLDFGLKTFITTSHNQRINNPKYHNIYLKRLARLQSQRDKMEKGTRPRKLKTRQIQKTWKRITNLRHDFNHKTANDLIKRYDTVYLERLEIQRFDTKIRNINRTYRDVCWNNFTNLLTYKAANAGKKLVFVNPVYTSQTCSVCGDRHALKLTEREFRCKCGNIMDRDVNAARNILKLGTVSENNLASGLRCLAKA